MKRAGWLVINASALLTALAIAPLHGSWAQGKIPIPEYYGIYAVIGRELIKLDVQSPQFKRYVEVRLAQKPAIWWLTEGQDFVQTLKVPEFSPGFSILVFHERPMEIASGFETRPLVYVHNASLGEKSSYVRAARSSAVIDAWDATSLGKPVELLLKPYPGRQHIVIAEVAGEWPRGLYRLSFGETRRTITFAVGPVEEGRSAKCLDVRYTWLNSPDSRFTPCATSITPTPRQGSAPTIQSQQQASKETKSVPPLSQPEPKSKDIASQKQKLNDFIIDQWRQVVQIPPPKRSLKELIALKITGKYDDYSSLYLLGVNRRNLSSDALKTAEKFLRKGNLETAQKYASLATRHYAESNQLFNSAEQIFAGSVGMTAQALEGIYRATREASVYGWTLICGPKCYEVADYAFLMTDFAVDYSLEGMDQAQKNLFAKSLVKALLNTGGISSWIENRTTQLIGSSGLYNLLDKALNSPNFQKALMKVLAESGAYATRRFVTSQLQKAIQEDANKIIDASRNFVRASSNLEPTQTANVASTSPATTSWPPGLYEVTTSAAVYEKPNQKARQVATIQRGTRVNVINVMGDWLEIRSRHERPPGFIRKNSAVPVKE